MNIRRKILVTLGAGLFTTPICSRAQSQTKVWRIGFLGPNSAASNSDRMGCSACGPARTRLCRREKSWHRVALGDGEFDRLPKLAAELVRLKVDVILTAGTPAIRADKNATATIPIVMVTSGDPVSLGFVASLSLGATSLDRVISAQNSAQNASS